MKGSPEPELLHFYNFKQFSVFQFDRGSAKYGTDFDQIYLLKVEFPTLQSYIRGGHENK